MRVRRRFGIYVLHLHTLEESEMRGIGEIGIIILRRRKTQYNRYYA